MAIQTAASTNALTNAVTTRYTQKYLRGATVRRLYDQLAGNIMSDSQFALESRRGMGSTYTFNFASDMTPGTTAISETADIVPQVLIDATSTITPTSLGEALKWSELLDIEAYTDIIGFRAEKVGENAMESIDNKAKAAALQGSLVERAVARTSLSGNVAAHTFTEAALWKVASLAQDLKCPRFIDGNGMESLMAIVHSDAYYDLFHGGNVLSAITYGGLPGNILLNGEIGTAAGFKLVVSPWAKVFGGAGIANASSSDTYVFSANEDKLQTTLSVTTGTNVIYGRLLSLGTEETGDTHYDTNERVKWISGTTSAVVVGSGANGGTRFAHTTAEYILNSQSVYPVAFGGPKSLAKVFANDVGEFGQMVGPLSDGLANQWQSLAWKWYGGYGRVAENQILRGEYASTLDAT
jgi:N4-gp56 family major capsid protein